MAEHRSDLPTIEAESQPFWEAAREGRLLLQRCEDCGAAQHYPRPFCASCWSERVRWEEASGKGRVYTYSVVHVNDLPPFAARVPYVVAAVDLDEGPRIMVNLVDVDPSELAVGMAVVVAFEQLTEEVTVPVFRPARGG
ncbi:MAG TPA: Zn-ribbon domain-containing OB-fold protein [Acidimicrobiales bacterium]|nr:Zn-ribbon domain-containing OB-fold protein [Acidimicrobiales bacterium]